MTHQSPQLHKYIYLQVECHLILKSLKNKWSFIQCKARQWDGISFRHYYYSSEAQSEIIWLVYTVIDHMPYMIVSNGLVSLPYKHMHETGPNELMQYHVLHQQHLTDKALELKEIMNTVIIAANLIRPHKLNFRQLRHSVIKSSELFASLKFVGLAKARFCSGFCTARRDQKFHY
jgi:hypothetical protein